MNRTVATSLTLVGLAVGYYALLGRLHLREIRDLHREVEACYTSFDQAEVEAAQVTTLKQSVRELERWQDELKIRLGHDPLAVPTTTVLRSTLESHGLVVERADPMVDDASFALPHQRTRVVATGEFAQLFAAIAGLENEAAPTRVTDLAIQATPDGNRVHAELTLVRMWSLER